eukprot:2480926-Amphidinium_carterae.1
MWVYAFQRNRLLRRLCHYAKHLGRIRHGHFSKLKCGIHPQPGKGQLRVIHEIEGSAAADDAPEYLPLYCFPVERIHRVEVQAFASHPQLASFEELLRAFTLELAVVVQARLLAELDTQAATIWQ